MKKIGGFTVGSGVLMVSDPCYNRDMRYSAIILNVKTGFWFAYMKQCEVPGWGTRVSKIVACHSDHALGSMKFKVYSNNEIRVNSGQCGIFDDKYFRDDSVVNAGMMSKLAGLGAEDGKWYSMCCAVTMDLGAGVIPGGVVSSSGLGDGMYRMGEARSEGKVVGIRITFMDDEVDGKDYMDLEKYDG